MALEPETCPYLGIPDDPRTRFTFATPAHRCYAKREPSRIGLGHQSAYCLSSEFPTCDRFPGPAAAFGAGADPARTARPIGISASTVAVGVPSAVRPRRPRDEPHAPRRSRFSARGRAALLLLVFLAAAGLIGSMVAGRLGTIASAPTTPASAIGFGASPSPISSPSRTAAPSPSPRIGPSPTPRPSTGPLQTIYVVKPGDSLWAIATRHGVTIQAIQQANKIKDPNIIQVGQRLIIPPRGQ
jgi:nucleoid-associated protein YgaU